jgi:hypothetical protein
MFTKTKIILSLFSLLYIVVFLPILSHAQETPVLSSPQEMKVTLEKKDWKADEAPAFDVAYDKDWNKDKSLWEWIISQIIRERVKVTLVYPDGKTVRDLKQGKDYTLEKTDSEIKVNLANQETMTPGKYQLTVKLSEGTKEVKVMQDFTWGVLAINTNKKNYIPNDEAYIQMGVLDDQGFTICDTDLNLKIKSPNGEEKVLTTQPSFPSPVPVGHPLPQAGEEDKNLTGERDNVGTIEKSNTCGPQTVTNNPDYWAKYILDKPGTYELQLTAKTKNGTYSQTANINVVETQDLASSLPFEVERIGPTRIYPVAKYEYKIKIKANQDFEGKIIEEIPDIFKIENLKIENSLKIGNWKLKIGGSANGRKTIESDDIQLSKGDEVALSYVFDAPDISPELFLFGPVKFIASESFWKKLFSFNFQDTTIYEDQNRWQIASDAVISVFNQRTGFIENDQNGDNITSGTALIGERMKVKIQIDTGTGDNTPMAFKLKYDKNDNSWQDVKPAGEIRPALSSIIHDQYRLGAPDSGSCYGGTTPRKGKIFEGTSISKAITFYASSCQEVGFVVDTKNATVGTTYRFKLVKASDGGDLSSYVAYPSFTTVATADNNKRFSMSNTINLATGATPPSIADMPYEADRKGYSNLAGDDGTREVLQNVNTKMVGTGVSASSADVIINGENTTNDYSALGMIASAGDVNGDGYGDVIVGSNGYSSSGNNHIGRAYIYYGGPSLGASFSANSANVIITGSAPDDYLGNSVASAGDVNGDGYSDVIVGASTALTGATRNGRAYIYYGGSSLGASLSANSADVIITGNATNNYFGSSVSSAGDVNGDLYSDVIVGANLYSAPGNNYIGRAYIFYGGSLGASISANGANVMITGKTAWDYFGQSATSAGDVNRDGYSDVIVGASLAVVSGSNRYGRAYIYYGGSLGASISANSANVIISGSYTGSFGSPVSSAGDVNGDGYSDVIVGESSYNFALEYATGNGAVYVYYGGSLGASISANSANIIIWGEALYDYFCSGYSAGDVNGDGYSDVIVGAGGYDAVAGNDNGRAYIFYGGLLSGTISASSASVIITGENSYDGFGFPASAGDVNGDGFSDIILGASGYSGDGPGNGRAYVYYGSYTAGTTPDKTFPDPSNLNNDYFGSSVASGDFNGDGYADALVGAYMDNSKGASTNRGRAYIYYGGLTRATTPGLSFPDPTNIDYDNFGWSVASGDFNGDGYPDALIGANGDNDKGADTYRGRAYIFSGGPSMSTAPSLAFPDPSNLNGDKFGTSVASGDFNGDGYADALIGAMDNSVGSANRGRAYIFSGGPSMSTAPSLAFPDPSNKDWDKFGWSAAAGDFNGDGYADALIGAYQDNIAGDTTNRGRAYIFSGGPSMSTAPSLAFPDPSNLNNDYFGSSVASGDFNGDGYADALIGAYMDNSKGASTNRGKAYIYYGKLSMSTAPSLAFPDPSNLDNDYFGYSAAAGDFNGDGYADALIGAYQDSSVGVNLGRAYIFSGGPSMSTAPSLAFSDPAGNNNDYFGWSVASGDFNSDGYADALIGASGDSSLGAGRGRTYIYYGGGNTAYPVFNFANKSGQACSGLSSITATWNGQSSVGASTKHIFLQVYNFNSSSWETPTNGENSALSANIDGDISVTLNSNLGYYCDGNNWSYWRAYQDSGNNILRSDYFTAGFTGGGEPPADVLKGQLKGKAQSKGSVRFR